MLPDIIECMMLNKKEEIKYFFYMFLIWKMILKTNLCLNRVSNRSVLNLNEISLNGNCSENGEIPLECICS